MPAAYVTQPAPEITLTSGGTGDRASPLPGAPAALVRTADASPSPAATQTVSNSATRPFNRITPTPVGLLLDPPVCTPSPGGLMCLGLVRNPLPIAVERIVLRATLSGQDGLAVTSAFVTTALSHLLAGGQSPYRAIFAGAIPADHTVSVSPVSADTSVLSRPQAVVTAQRLEISGTQVRMYASIANTTSAPLPLARAIFMVSSPGDVLEGYIVSSLEGITVQPGGQLEATSTLLLSGARDIDFASLRLTVLVETAPPQAS